MLRCTATPAAAVMAGVAAAVVHEIVLLLILKLVLMLVVSDDIGGVDDGDLVDADARYPVHTYQKIGTTQFFFIFFFMARLVGAH